MSLSSFPARDVARRRAPRPTPRREVGMEVGTPRALVHVGCKRVCPSRPQAGHYMYMYMSAATRARARATQPGPAESECTKVPCRAGSKGPEPVKQRAAPAGTFACAVRPSRLPLHREPSYDGRDGEHCCITCRDGVPCSENWHRTPQRRARKGGRQTEAGVRAVSCAGGTAKSSRLFARKRSASSFLDVMHLLRHALVYSSRESMTQS